MKQGAIDVTITYTSDFNSEPCDVETRKTLEPSGSSDTPVRYLITAPSMDEDRVFSIVWKNTNIFTSRHIVYSLDTVIDDNFSTSGRLGINQSINSDTTAITTFTILIFLLHPSPIFLLLLLLLLLLLSSFFFLYYLPHIYPLNLIPNLPFLMNANP